MIHLVQVMSHLFSIQNVNKSFSERIVLKNICAEINSGEVILINGRSGSGKTTLLNLLAGLGNVDSGNILFNNKDITTLTMNQRCTLRLSSFGIVYQSFNFLPSLTLKENILVPALMLGTPKKTYTERLDYLANLFSISHCLNQFLTTVSGGELQRAAIIRALINSPKVILADEPSGNLDTHQRDIIFATFNKIASLENVTIIMTSHDPHAKKNVNRILELNDGQFIKK